MKPKRLLDEFPEAAQLVLIEALLSDRKYDLVRALRYEGVPLVACSDLAAQLRREEGLEP